MADSSLGTFAPTAPSKTNQNLLIVTTCDDVPRDRGICRKASRIEIGQIFGALTVLREGDRSAHGHKQWVCACSCGNEKQYRKFLLVSGQVRSCGCKRSEHYSETFSEKWARGERRSAPTGWKLGPPSEDHKRKIGNATKTHGLSKTKIYTTWINMKWRCIKPTNKDYSRYGGRGIKISQDWLIFENFLADMGLPPSQSHTIDRINNDGNYEKSNCRWATKEEQANNRRSSKIVSFEGVDMSVSNVARLCGIPSKSLQYRLRKGNTILEAIAAGIPIGRK